MDDVRKNEYGSALASVGVFAIIMKEEMYDSGGYCERQYYSKVKKENSYEESCWKEKRYYSTTKKVAEVRLRINYRDFVFAKPENQIIMCKELILRAFEIAVEKIQKIDKQFRGEELLADVNEALGTVKRNLYWV